LPVPVASLEIILEKNAKQVKATYSKQLRRELMQTKSRKLVLVGSIIAIIALVAFFSLAIYATSVKVELLDAYSEYPGNYSHNRYSATVTISVGNPSSFPVTVRDMGSRLTVNGVDMLGVQEIQEEWYVIPAFGWRQWTETFYAFGEYADFLHSSETQQVLVDLRGYASCMFYETFFQLTSEKLLIAHTGLG
jgi:hypothetical protein